MAIFKCKMCGGTIEFEQGSTVGVCDSCGTKQTLPKLDDERRTQMYDRANHFRRNNEFDKAMGIYESILNEDNSDAEAYWSLVLCRYGIEYVEDPTSHKRVPTVNRAQYTSIFADEDYKSALANADVYQKSIYEDEAKAIDEIQKGILEISQKEEPFDVFICYKETGADGRRTVDSVRATELYHELTKEGFKVFFARITLEDKLGSAYEPYIFAALNSAKVMVVLGSKAEHFNAVWVKNEWSRYLALIKSGAKKALIPAYENMDPYDLPEEFSHLQAQDMTKLGFMQDLIRGIKKLTATDEPKATVQEKVVINQSSGINTSALLDRGFMALEDGEWDKADSFFEDALNQDAKNAECYLGKLMAELKVKNKDNLKNCSMPFDDNNNCKKASKFDSAIAEKLKADNELIRERNEIARKTDIYNKALREKNSAKTEAEYKSAASAFASIKGFKDADEKNKECLEKAEIARKDAIYDLAMQEMSADTNDGYKSAISKFESIIDWKDSREKINECNEGLEKLRIAAEKAEAERKRKAEEARIEAEKTKAKTIKLVKIISPIVAVVIVFLIVLNTVILPAGNYKKAIALVDAGNYSEAYSLFGKYADYKDTQTKIKETKLKEATALLDAKKYDEAYKILKEIGDTETINESIYNRAIELASKEEYEAALVLFNQLTGYKDAEDQIEKCYIGIYGEEKWNIIKNLKVGDIYTFGAYEQDNNTSNGKEAIEWIVLAKEGNKILIISKYALDCQQYNTSYTDVTWETCTLRKWMNNDFLNAAFSAEEQKQIQNTTVTADANPSYSTNAGNDTNDKVFLLSINEVNKYFSSADDRMCVPTAYAKSNGAYTSSSYSKGGEATCWWWLRSPGGYSNLAADVDYAGGVNYDGNFVNDSYDCVRPALWIEI